MSFTQKIINHTLELGLDLRDLRERAGFTRAQASQKTKILPSIITDWEDNNWQSDDPIYTERMLTSYVNQLGGNTVYFLEKYRKILVELRARRKNTDLVPAIRHVRFWHLMITARIWKILGFTLFAGLLASYIFYLVADLRRPPELIVHFPTADQFITSPKLVVRGHTTPDAFLDINQEQVLVQSNGDFEKVIELPLGLTTLKITAKRRYGSSNSSTINVYHRLAQ